MKLPITLAAPLLAILTILAAAPFTQARAADPEAVLKTYADIAQAKYEDSLATAKVLKSKIDALVAHPSAAALTAARDAWKAARVPYQQTEAYRFGNAIVDEWEGKVNAWPLDEGLIDYVDASYGTSSDENRLYTMNVIAHPRFKLGAGIIDASTIDAKLIRSLHEADDVEANVATGYHAIEFLLWGQDLHGTGKGAGERPYTDYAKTGCTHGHCDRRAAYLTTATEMLVSNLSEMAANWKPGGAARTALAAGGPAKGLMTILTGMGSMSYGELGGQRMKLGLLLHDPEQEHDCFSDNTHNSHYYDAMGIRDAYLGQYKRVDGTMVKGAALTSLVREKAPGVDTELRAKLDATMAKMTILKRTADSGEMAYDEMIGEGNDRGNAIVQAAIDGLVAQTKSIEKAVAALDLGAPEFEGSDSLDKPEKVF